MMSFQMTEMIANSIDYLLQCRIVEEITLAEGSKFNGETIWSFDCIVTIPFPNSQALPEKIRLKVELNEHYPYSGVKCFSLTEELRGFPHQDAVTHKICLKEEWRAPTNEKKLAHYMAWVKEWITDAASKMLVTSSDPYELPDFSIKGSISKHPTLRQFFFNEDNDTFYYWKDMLGKNGTITCNVPKSMNALFLAKFWCEGKEIHKIDYAESLFDPKNNITGIWQLLPNICFFNHRPPQTFGELRDLFTENKLQLDFLLKKAWEIDNHNVELAFVLIGFPIPKYFYSDPKEVHWIPIIFNNERADKKLNPIAKKKRKLWDSVLLKRFNKNDSIVWGKSININSERQFVRGKLQNSLAKNSVSLFGCGALGSQIAEYLVRGGVQNISLYDNDILMMGNLSRHTLDGSGCGFPKAELLRDRLCKISPLSHVCCSYYKIPIGVDEFKSIQAIFESDLLIDCTTDHNAFLWLSSKAQNFNKRLISVFFNFNTDLCVLLISGKSNSCLDVYNDLMDRIRAGSTKIDPIEYFRIPSKDEQILEGIGCWHATFPGKGFHIGLLASSAIDIIENHSNNVSGVAAVIKRNHYAEYTSDKRIIELLFFKSDYE